MTRLVYFKWMGAYWSCSRSMWNRLQKAADHFQAIELSGECKELKFRPNGQIEVLKENK